MISSIIFKTNSYNQNLLTNIKYFEQDYSLFRKTCPLSELHKQIEKVQGPKRLPFYHEILTRLLDYVSVEDIKKNRTKSSSISYFFQNEQEMTAYIQQKTGLTSKELFIEEVEALMLCINDNEVEEVCKAMLDY